MTYYFVFPPIMLFVLSTIAIYILPRRSLRAAGRRKVVFPSNSAGVVLIGLCVGIVAVAIGKHKYDLIVRVLQPLLPLASLSLYMGRRAKRNSLAEVLDKDNRAPVLYLRAFKREASVFVTHSSFLERLSSEYGQAQGKTFEQWFSSSINQHIGPFVALGSPEDYVPPEGAARMYASDDNWTVHFLDLARRAACILMVPDHSGNLIWELQTLRKEGLSHKIFIFTSPKPHPSGAVAWSAFIQTMLTAGYSLDMGEPGVGAVIGINSGTKVIILTTGARNPEEFLAPVNKKLSERRRGGYKTSANVGENECNRSNINISGTVAKIARARQGTRGRYEQGGVGWPCSGGGTSPARSFSGRFVGTAATASAIASSRK